VALVRPRFTDQEVTFLLKLLSETEAAKKRQVLNLREEQEHLQREVWSLRQRVWNEGPYPIFREWKREKQKLDKVNLWLPVCSKQDVILKDLIIRFEKLLAHKRGRMPRRDFSYLLI